MFPIPLKEMVCCRDLRLARCINILNDALDDLGVQNGRSRRFLGGNPQAWRCVHGERVRATRGETKTEQ
jgi:hypothetical protein